MITRLPSLLAAGALALGLAACGNGNSPPPPPPPVVTPPAPPPTTESMFGSCFATRFDAKPFTTATDPVPCPDLAPLSLTTKPIAL